MTTIGGSLFLIAVGAIPRFAVTAEFAGIDLQTVGVILMGWASSGWCSDWIFLMRRPPGLPPV